MRITNVPTLQSFIFNVVPSKWGDIFLTTFYDQILFKFSPLPVFEPGTYPVASCHAFHWAVMTWYLYNPSFLFSIENSTCRGKGVFSTWWISAVQVKIFINKRSDEKISISIKKYCLLLVPDRQTNSLTPYTGRCVFFLSVKFALLASLAGD